MMIHNDSKMRWSIEMDNLKGYDKCYFLIIIDFCNLITTVIIKLIIIKYLVLILFDKINRTLTRLVVHSKRVSKNQC